MRFLAAIMLASLASATLADGIYKWKDEKGVVHFGSQPPKEKKVEVVRKPKSERYKQWQEEQAALETQKKVAVGKATGETAPDTKKEDRPGPSLTQAEQAVRAQRCRMAKANLTELTTHSRVREIDASGKMRVLPEEERQARIRRARELIETNC